MLIPSGFDFKNNTKDHLLKYFPNAKFNKSVNRAYCKTDLYTERWGCICFKLENDIYVLCGNTSERLATKWLMGEEVEMF